MGGGSGRTVRRGHGGDGDVVTRMGRVCKRGWGVGWGRGDEDKATGSGSDASTPPPIQKVIR